MMDKNRRKILATGLAALGTFFMVTPKTKAATGNCKKVKVLTRDGRVVEIPECKLRNKAAKAEEEEVRNWLIKSK